MTNDHDIPSEIPTKLPKLVDVDNDENWESSEAYKKNGGTSSPEICITDSTI